MNYPWHQAVHGPDLEQGDIFESCPVFLPRADLPPLEDGTLFFDEELCNIIVVSQTCDPSPGGKR